MGLFNSVITAGCSEIWFSVIEPLHELIKRQFHSDEELMKSGNWKKKNHTQESNSMVSGGLTLSEPPCWDEPGLQEKGDRTWLMSKENNENQSKPRAWASSLHRLRGLLFFSLCDLAQALYLLQDSVFSPVKWEQE